MIEPGGTLSMPALALAGAALSGLLWFGAVHLLPRPLAWKAMVIAAAVFAMYAIVGRHAPAWVGTVVAVITMFTFFGVVFLTLVGMGSRSAATRRLRRSFRKVAETGELPEARLDGPALPELETRAGALEQLGFERLFAAKGERMVRIVLLRRQDGIVGEVTSPSMAPPADPTPVIELTSILLDRRGLVCTGTSGRRLVAWAGELRQVFPGSDPVHLVDYHEDVLRFVRDRNVEADLLTPEQVPDAERWGRAMVAAASARVSTEEIRKRARSFSSGGNLHVGALEADLAVEDRMAAFWDAVNAQEVRSS